MARVYKTARGKAVDMDKVKLANETTRAVGNMRVNARGDLLDKTGQVAAGRNQIMDQVYSVSPGYSPTSPENFSEQQAMVEASKAQELHNLANNLTTPGPIETVDPESTDTPTAPAARGSLAGSVAKTVSVNQQPIPDPRKSKGPSRI